MNGLQKLSARFKQAAAKIETITADSIEATKEKIIELNKEQMSKGLDIYGQSLGVYRDPLYAAQKAALNPIAGGRKDYKLKGDYYRGFYINVKNPVIQMGSADPKAAYPSLSGKDKRFGLTSEAKKVYGEQSLKPIIIKKIMIELTNKK